MFMVSLILLTQQYYTFFYDKIIKLELDSNAFLVFYKHPLIGHIVTSE